MLHPPERFEQLQALAWAGPLLGTMAVGGAAWNLGLRPGWLVLVLALLAGAVLWTLALQAIWTSHFGVRHARGVAASLFLALCLPLALLFAPVLARVADSVPAAAAALAALQAIALATGYVLHRRQARTDGAARALEWAGCRVDLDRFTVAPPQAPDRGRRWLSPAIIGGLAVAAYHALAAALPESGLALVGLLGANALAAWVAAGPVARALAQAGRLRALEKRQDKRFAHARIAWLQAERSRHPLGRRLAGRAS